MRYDHITELIGNTPLLRIDPKVHGLKNIDVFAKLEMQNPFGSVKDRIAWSMLRDNLDEIRNDKKTVLEFSSGNTAKALAALASVEGVHFKTVTNRMKVPEIKQQLMVLGAEINELPGQSECLDPTDNNDPMAQVYRLMTEDEDCYFHTDQYFNPRNPEAHMFGTGVEIIDDLDGEAPDFYITGVGTSGSSIGTAVPMRKNKPEIKVVGLVAEKSDFIPGIRNIDEVHEVGLFNPNDFDGLESISSQQAIDGMTDLIRRCGILAGPTAGANYFGTIRHLKEIDQTLTERKTAVFLVCDRFDGYMSYIQARRPELLAAAPKENSLATVTEEEIKSAVGIDVSSAQQWMNEVQPTVVDLRGSFAYRALHIEGSINIVDSLFEDMMATGLPVDCDQPLLLVCPVGDQSRKFAGLLQRMGHNEARTLEGGVMAWRSQGAPLVRS